MIGLLMISITLWGFGQDSAVESLSALEVVLTRTVYHRFFYFFLLYYFFIAPLNTFQACLLPQQSVF